MFETRESIKTALDDIRASLHERFPEATARLQQLDGHIATVAMVVDHIHDEAERSAK